MNDLLRPRHAAERDDRILAQVDRRFAPLSIDIGGIAMKGDRAVAVTLAQEQVAELGLADARGVLQHCVEHRL